MTTVVESGHTEIVRFLLACLDEEDAALRRIIRAEARGGPAAVLADGWTPARLQADCTAKRQIVGTMQQLIVLRDQPSEKAVRDAAGHVLKSLATPYAESAGFRSEWRVSARR